MNNSCLLGALYVCAFFLGLTSTASASIIRVSFQATVFSVTPRPDSQVSIGDTVTGFFSYESNANTPTSMSVSGNQKNYDIAIRSYHIEANGFDLISVSFDQNTGIPTNNLYTFPQLSVIDHSNPIPDNFIVAIIDNDNNFGGSSSISLVALDDTLINSADLPSSFPTPWDTHSINGAGSAVRAWNGSLLGGEFTADITSLSTTVIPVPAAIWLFGSGLLGLICIEKRNHWA